MDDRLDALTALCDDILRADDPAKIFGPFTGDRAADLRLIERIYHRLVAELDSGEFYADLDSEALGRQAKTKLDQLYEQAKTGLAFLTPICSPSGTAYRLQKALGRSPRFNLYECILPDGRVGLLKIAADPSHNPLLDREALILRTLKERSLEIDAETTDDRPVHYHYCFPNVEESWVEPSQGGRRITTFSFAPMVKSFGQLTPLSVLVDRERMIVDPRTAAWIIGKPLKILTFAHGEGVKDLDLGLHNILIDRDLHGVLLLNWTSATQEPHPPTSAIVQALELAKVGHRALAILGGDLETETLPPSDQLPDDRFKNFLMGLAQGGFTDSRETHRRFYELIRSLWPKGFHPFTSFPRSS